jgi:putative transposase
MAHTFTKILLHIVFGTKDRKPMLDFDMRQRLYPYMGGVLRELGCSMIAVNGTSDHVHILAFFTQDKAVSEIMRVLKTNSSKWIHDSFPQYNTFAWQLGYGCFSVSESVREDVCKYIASQEEHHRKMTYEEEFISFLKKYAVPYDPALLWK